MNSSTKKRGRKAMKKTASSQQEDDMAMHDKDDDTSVPVPIPDDVFTLLFSLVGTESDLGALSLVNKHVHDKIFWKHPRSLPQRTYRTLQGSEQAPNHGLGVEFQLQILQKCKLVVERQESVIEAKSSRYLPRKKKVWKQWIENSVANDKSFVVPPVRRHDTIKYLCRDEYKQVFTALFDSVEYLAIKSESLNCEQSTDVSMKVNGEEVTFSSSYNDSSCFSTFSMSWIKDSKVNKSYSYNTDIIRMGESQAQINKPLWKQFKARLPLLAPYKDLGDSDAEVKLDYLLAYVILMCVPYENNTRDMHFTELAYMQ